MADTTRKYCPEKRCSDCSKMGTLFHHWGDLVLEGDIGDFCHGCFMKRTDRINAGKSPLPLGQTEESDIITEQMS